MTLANGWENAKVTSPWCANRPNTKMSTSPNTANVTGPSQRRQGLTGAASAFTTGACSVMVMRSPLPDRPATPAARVARSRYMARISGGAATNSTISASSTSTMSTGV